MYSSLDGKYKCVEYRWNVTDEDTVIHSFSTTYGGSNVITREPNITHNILAKGNKLLVSAKPPAIRAEVSFHNHCEIYNNGDTIKFSTNIRLPAGWKASRGRKAQFATILVQFKMPMGGPHLALTVSNDGNNRLFLKDLTQSYDLGTSLSSSAKTHVEIYLKHSTGQLGAIKVRINGQHKLSVTKKKTVERVSDLGYVKVGMYTQIHRKRKVAFGKTTLCKLI